MMRHCAAFVVLIALTLGISLIGGPASGALAQDATPATDCPTTTEEENAAIAHRWYDDLWNPHDLTAIDDLLSDDHVHHWGIGPDTEGVADFTERIQATWADYPAQYTVEQTIVDGEFVVLRWLGEGTGEGAPVTFTGVNIFRIECGKIVEVWSELDSLGLLQQTGALPAGTPAP